MLDIDVRNRKAPESDSPETKSTYTQAANKKRIFTRLVAGCMTVFCLSSELVAIPLIFYS